MDDEEVKEEPIDEEILDPLEEGAMNDFRFDEESDEDPDSRYH